MEGEGEVIPQVKMALCRALLPTGFAVVPIELTPQMLRAACKSMSPGRRPTQEWVSVREKHTIRYQAMVAAAADGRP